MNRLSFNVLPETLNTQNHNCACMYGVQYSSLKSPETAKQMSEPQRKESLQNGHFNILMLM
jgi:hypothetical protein